MGPFVGLKIFHTSDWHLAHQWMGRSRLGEHRLFLDWLEGELLEQQPDALLVSGDIFDHGMPSHEVQGLYYESLIKLRKTGCRNIILAAGNHDSATFLDASKKMLGALGVKVIAQMSRNLEDHLVDILGENDEVLGRVMAFPYFRERELRSMGGGEGMEGRKQSLMESMSGFYRDLGQRAREKSMNVPLIGMGHFYAVGAQLSDTEREIYLGELEAVSLEQLGLNWDYLALGHLHRAQKVGASGKAWYSGTPMAMSFSEASHAKSIMEVSFEDSLDPIVEKRAIPHFRKTLRVECEPDDLEAVLSEIEEGDQLATWCELCLTKKAPWDWLQNTIEASLKDRNIDVLSVRFIERVAKEDDGMEELESLELLTPQTLFEKHLEELNIEKEEQLVLKTHFDEVCEEIAQEGVTF